MEIFQDTGQEPGAPEHGNPHPEPPGLIAEQHAHLTVEPAGDGQDSPGIMDIPFSRFGQYEALALSAEQWHAQVLLQIADVDAQGRLGNIQPVSRPGQVAAFSQRTDIPLFF